MSWNLRLILWLRSEANFPLGIWVVGILLSLFCLLTEIIVHRLSISTEASPESEDGHNSNVEDIERLS